MTLTQAFYLGRYEVTQAQWAAVMGSKPSEFRSVSSYVPAEQVPNRPVERISWEMIQDFEVATGLRLPTKAEWEYACRAGRQTAFNFPPSGTNDDGLLGQLAWFNQNAASQTHPVGQKQADNFGLYDMHGNVWEWSDSRPFVLGGAVFRIVRGGAWDTTTKQCRSSHRALGHADTGFSNRGLRVARNP